MMRVVCVWCKEELGWRQGPEGQVTHGICKPCQARVCHEQRRLSSQQKALAAIGFALLLLLYGVAGECDRRDAEDYAKVRGEISRTAPSWAVTR